MVKMPMDIEERFTAPPRWRWDYLQCPDRGTSGHKIRYGFCHAANPQALVVIAPGRTQTSEEYFELARDFLKRGFSAAVMDWQGHGDSYRLNNDPTRHHSYGFDADITDFGLFVDHLNAIDEFHALPRILVAHSMGGNISLRYLAAHNTPFICGIMIAPMLGIRMNGFFQCLATPLLHFTQYLGLETCHAPTQGRWSETTYDVVKHILTSDPVRQDIQKFWFKRYPELQCGGVTYGWIDEALKSCDILKDPATARAIETPLFFALAEKEQIVSNSSAQNMIDLLPHAAVETIDGAHHVIHAERDPIRNRLLQSMDSFIQKHLPL